MRKSTSMRRSTSILFFTATAITAMLLASTPAQAVSNITIPTISTIVLTGTNGKVDVGEFTFSPTGGYFVDVIGAGIQVFGFAVSTNDSSAYPTTTRPGWKADFVSQAAWDAGFGIGFPPGGPPPLLTTDIGLFSDFFTDLFANLYHNENYWGAIMGVDLSDTTGNNTNQPFPTVSTNAQFFFGGNSSSHFVAFTSTGGVISQSLPEPSTIVLLGSGLAGIIAWRMRKAKA